MFPMVVVRLIALVAATALVTTCAADDVGGSVASTGAGETVSELSLTGTDTLTFESAQATIIAGEQWPSS